MNRNLFRLILFLTLTVVPAGASLHAQCSQPTREQEAIIREAEKDRYTTRRVEFINNRYTRDEVLRRRINIGLQEGEFFTRRNLLRSLQNVSKLKQIYPVKMRDVELHLNPSDLTVDVMICLQPKERRRRTRWFK
jgi:outer membrane protein assembly factor BamA